MTRINCNVECFDSDRIALGRLFGDQVEDDPWVIFHGKSASNSAAIETDGFSFIALPGLALGSLAVSRRKHLRHSLC